MDISIIIPVYNVEKYVRECLDSIISQTKTEGVECIIVDDCGSDKSMTIVNDIVTNYEGKISFIILYQEENKGLSAARNKGIKVASGDYICFIDSDDKFSNNDSLKLFWDLVMKHKDVDVVQGNSYIEEINDFDVKKSRFPEFTSDSHWVSHAFSSLMMPESSWNKLVKRQLLINNSLYFKEGWIQEDTLWTYELHSYVKSVAFCFIPTYFYRYNSSGIMHGSGNVREAEAFTKIFNKVYSELLLKEVQPGDIKFLEINASRVYKAVGSIGFDKLLPNNKFGFKLLFRFIALKMNYKNILIKGPSFIAIYIIRYFLRFKLFF